MRHVNRDELRQYVRTLPTDLQDLFHAVDGKVLTMENTLSEEFQMWADILSAFETRARLWFEEP